jgi:hypothetical protein
MEGKVGETLPETEGWELELRSVDAKLKSVTYNIPTQA